MRLRGDRKPRPPTPQPVKDTPVSGAQPPKARKIDAHFIILEDLWRQFQAKLPNLGYSTASEYLRQCVRDVVEERDEKR